MINKTAHGNPAGPEYIDPPPQFLWGAATAAFQIEGAANLHGRGPSIWDLFCHTPGATLAGDTGDTACDSYNRWREDVALMQQLNLNAYRFSISWPRVMPSGRAPINAIGLAYYDRLVDALCEARIQPLVTLYHWDLPASLQTHLGGWTHDDLPNIFADYAAVIFDRLGDRVKLWITINEPWVIVDAGYFHGVHPPGIKDRAAGYRAGHNLLRAHAYTVQRFRAARHAGQIGLALNSSFSFPQTDSPADRAAARRAVESFAGWFGDPLYHGDYPRMMRDRLDALLPRFTPRDAALLKRSTDFIALNYYTSEIVRDAPDAGPMQFEVVPQPDAPHTQMNWPIRPDGFYELLHWLNHRYPGLPFYITENGAAMHDEPDEHGHVHDPQRIAYLRDHIAAAFRARHEGVDLRGYFVWSLLDNLEWAAGFSKRFGLVRCDHATQKRTIKSSGRWYARLIRTGRLRGDDALDESHHAHGVIA